MFSKGAERHYIEEVIGTALILFGLLVGVSLFSYHPADPSFSTVSSEPVIHNAVGKVGAIFSDLVVQFVGIGAYFLPLFFIMMGIQQVSSPRAQRQRIILVSGFFLMAITLAALRDLGWDQNANAPTGFLLATEEGGLLGRVTAHFFLKYFAKTGTLIIFSSLFLIGAMLAFPFSPTRTLKKTARLIGKLQRWALEKWGKSQAQKELEQEALFDDIPPTPMPQTKKKTRVSRKRAAAPQVETPAEAETALPEVAPPPPRIATKPEQEIFDFNRDDLGDYRLPPLTLLADPPLLTSSMTQKELIAQSQILQKKLRDFDVEGRITQVHPGPVITMFEFEPAPGIKLNKITNLSDDLALAMKALHVRIVAPLPGKAAVGIEVPNRKRESVFLKEVLSSPSYNRMDSKLRLALGKDIVGSPVAVDLAKMPHLLIAGATGSGKSVGLNGMILSLLFSSTPAEVKLLMIDPKMLEFNLYDGIPHLITPVITKPKLASGALKKMVAEMQRRYELLSENSVRNITAFNKLAAQSETLDPLPFIVVLIDELADLMMVASKDVENSIARLAQMARAAGIHLVLATQRPSVDVLTGLIKANFPARIAFNVSSKTDSRTILDANGAEQLLGKGDMLYLSAGTGKLERVHGAYIAEEEVKKVVAFIKEQSKPHYENSFSEEASLKSGSGLSSEPEERDERYEDARELVISTKQASASFLQRRMRVGYPRAARMIEMMEEDGLIGPAIGSKPREVLIRNTEEEGDPIE